MDVIIYTMWHDVKNKLPQTGEYVLIETMFCKYPFIVAYYNGINFINAVDHTVIHNVECWGKPNTPSRVKDNPMLLEDKEKTIKTCMSCEKQVEYTTGYFTCYECSGYDNKENNSIAYPYDKDKLNLE